MNILIRQASPSDAQVIAQFNALMAEETEQIKLDPVRLQQGVEAILNDLSKGIYFVAELDAMLVGQLMITYEWSDWRNGNFWWIQSVYVDKAYRGQGVFSSLFQHVRSIAQNRKDVCGLRLYVEQRNERAQRTYEALGMKRSHYEMFELDFVL